MSIQVFRAGSSPSLQTKTVTPTTSTTTYSPSSGYDGFSNFTVNGDNNLISGNIKSGVSIFGINGNYSANLVGTDKLSVSGGGNKIRTLKFTANSIPFTPSCLIASYRFSLGVSSSDTDYFVSSITCFKNPEFC